jgi:hypothetical protein
MTVSQGKHVFLRALLKASVKNRADKNGHKEIKPLINKANNP